MISTFPLAHYSEIKGGGFAKNAWALLQRKQGEYYSFWQGNELCRAKKEQPRPQWGTKLSQNKLVLFPYPDTVVQQILGVLERRRLRKVTGGYQRCSINSV